MRKRFRPRSLFLAFAGLAVSIVAPVPTRAAPATNTQQSAASSSRLEYRLGLGDTAVYRIQYSGQQAIDMGRLAGALAPTGASSIGAPAKSRIDAGKHALSAKLHWKVVGVDRGGWLISARLQEAHLSGEGEQEARRSLVELPFTFRLSRNGVMHSFEFRRGYPIALQLVIKGLVEPLQVVVDGSEAQEWTTRESNLELAFEGNYRRWDADPVNGTVRLTRQKSAVSLSPEQQATLESVGPLKAEFSPTAATTIGFSTLGKGVIRIEATEGVTIRTGNALLTSHSGTYRAERLAKEAVASLPDTEADAKKDLADRSVGRGRMYEIDRPFAVLVEGRDTTSILADFRKGLSPTPAYGMTLLQNYVRRYPGRSLEVARALDAQHGDGFDKQTGYGLAAIAAAGHVEAQKALIEVASGAGWSALARKKSLYAMIHLEAPEPFLPARVLALQSRAVPVGIDRDLYFSVITNVYGSLGNTKTADRDMTVEVVRNLGAMLRQAGNDRSRIYVLDGLSNVGDLALVAPLVAPYFASPNAVVRDSAFSTFRRMPGDEAFAQFEARFAREGTREVLQGAARTALQMADTAARARWARGLVAKPASVDHEVLQSVTRILGAGMKAHPENREALKQMLDSVTDRTIRRMIYAFVGPTRPGSSR